MGNRYFRLDSRSSERFREIENYGRTWQIDHYFLSRDELPTWLRSDPPLDTTKLKLSFAEKPKAKKIPQFSLSAGRLHVESSAYDAALRSLAEDYVTVMPLSISDVPYYFVRPNVIIDCIDEVNSKWRQRDDGYRYSWPRIVLVDVPTDAPPVFRPGVGREFWNQPIFSESFVKACMENRLIGAEFEEVSTSQADL